MIRRRAFTLVEMLLVVAVLVMLISMLLPSMRKAAKAAYTVKCLANLHAHGIGIHAYLKDNRDTFASTYSWTDLSGKAGDPVMNPTNLYGANTLPYEQRPLNKYLGSQDSSECPADLGDSYAAAAFNTITNCYRAYGNSYQAPFSYDVLRTKYVFGQVNASGVVTSKPSRYRQFKANFANKVIQGDFVWWGNRSIANAKSRWHTEGTARRYCMLFADWHAALTEFPPDQEAYWPGAEPAPNSASLWW